MLLRYLKKVALELGYDNVDTDPRLIKTYKDALENGYDADIVGNEVLVVKICEECGTEFKVNYFRRNSILFTWMFIKIY